MTTYVLDTSVVVQWFQEKNELHNKNAKQILDDLVAGNINILISDQLALELLNALLVGKKSPPAETKFAIDKLFELPLNIVEINLPLLNITAELMLQYNMTSYDAYFLALAKQENCKLISDDQKSHGKIKDEKIIMLEDYPSS